MKYKNLMQMRGRPVALAAVVLLVFITGCSGGNETERMAKAGEHLQNDEPAKAIIELKNVLQSNASNDQARVMLADSYLAVGDGKSAEKELKRAAELGVPESDLLSRKAQALLAQHQYDRILEELDPQQISGSDRKYLLVAYAEARLAKGEEAEAASLLEAALGIDPAFPKALVGMARINVMRENLETAVTQCQKAVLQDPGFTEGYLVMGAIHFQRQEFDTAEIAFEKAMESLASSFFSKQHFAAHVSLIQTLLAEKRLEKAATRIAAFRKILPEHPIGAYFSGLHHFMVEEYEAAEGELKQVISASPDHLPTLLLLGSVHFARQNYEQANAYLSQYVNKVPNHLQARKLLGMTRLKLNQHESALEALEPALDNAGGDVEILKLIGNAASRSGDHLSGTRYLEQAVKADPGNSAIREELAKAYLRKGSIDQAIEELETLSDADLPKNRLMLIYAYLRKKEFSEAIKLTDELIAETPNSPMLTTLKGSIHVMQGKRLTGRRQLLQALTFEPGYLPAHFALARFELEGGSLGSAKKRFKKILELDARNVTAMLGLSQIADKQGDQQQAEQWVERAREADQNATLPRYILARHYLKRGERSKANAILGELERINPDNPVFLLLMGNSKMQAGDYAGASHYLSMLVDKSPQSISGYLGLAGAEQRMGRLSSAKHVLEKLLEIQPDNVRGKVMLVSNEIKAGNTQEAEQLAKSLLQNERSRYWGYLLLGDLYLKNGQYEQAELNLSEGLGQFNTFAIAEKLAKTHLLRNNKQKAIDVLMSWKKQHPDDVKGELGLASIYQSSGDNVKAQAMYEEVLQADGNNVIALNNLALLVASSDPQKALNFAERAYNAASGNEAIADTYGWLLFRSGERDKGREIIEEIGKATQNPAILYHYAEILYESGNIEQAIRALNRALDSAALFPERETALKLKQRLMRQ
ncbi:XrtA/PEP-CTERM system TPR-repeat protein PrsT [Candidatus Endoriftia persephonae]|jgi:putative PEP-CTERM system TPR-repeat lipoprotein|uniref:TPR repeat-containing protein n=2 Tax=Gammaproteobacteria TaxID=1236 RepID=G2FHH8_9GAMM|nr:XrtA/PEP-CTERM system TPR-repeat protein PrsT [Candidatus Endoriftia persephone]EGW53738.1 TPR repeat-containing protein [endosymbiont of Tevnia jerichonana (vent Tica)]USF86437.1 PEP-CTERM system TPR-repeat protein PrsT [Candidatus Endoriftia persephone]